jgi:HemY protein
MTLLLRWMVTLGMAALASMIALWLAQHPATLQMDVAGYRVETKLWVVVMAFLLVLLCCMGILWGMMRVGLLFSRSGWRRRLSHQQKGIDSLTKVITALSLSDYSGAAVHLKQSRRLLGEKLPLNVLLHAHISSKQGNKAEALAALHQMQTAPETRFLALSSLSAVARREGQTEDALRYAKEAYQLRPNHSETAFTYLSILVKTGSYAEARALVQRLRSSNAVSKVTAKQALARIAVCQAQQSEGEASVNLYIEALLHDVTFSPAYYAIIVTRQRGERRSAIKMLMRSWKASPHPELVDILLHYFDDDGHALQIKRAHRFVAMHPKQVESQLAVARIAIQFKEWELARNHLKAALSLAPQKRVFRLLATLEEQGFNDNIAAAAWIKRLDLADADPEWHCHECGHASRHWQAHCESCDTFDGLVWEARAAHVEWGKRNQDTLAYVPN